MTDTAQDDAKQNLREQAHAQRASVRGGVRHEAANAAAAHFFASVPVSNGQVIAVYWPIRDEIDSKPVLGRLMDEGHKVCLPVVVDDESPLSFRLWELGEPLFEAGFGTLAPSENAPLVEPDIIVIPLLGFDAAGTRLGYGKGYYDRTIAALSKKPVLIGYAFSAQELDAIPAEPHDVPLDYLVTEAGVRTFS